MHMHHHHGKTPTGPVAPAKPGDLVVIDLGDDERPTYPPPGDFGGVQFQQVEVNLPLLGENQRLATENRAHFQAHGVKAVNLVSGPGAGKTTLLARTLQALAEEIPCGVLVGDLETDADARRLRHPKVPVAQITTGSACHLDAHMVGHGFEALDSPGMRLLFIENVGNLVCPAEFDLGESVRVGLFSCTDGEDKPLKYPPLYKSVHVVLLTKTDLAEAAGFDRALARENLAKIAPQARVFELSSKTGEGFEAWLDFLRGLLA